jgi:hypothetical protein
MAVRLAAKAVNDAIGNVQHALILYPLAQEIFQDVMVDRVKKHCTSIFKAKQACLPL